MGLKGEGRHASGTDISRKLILLCFFLSGAAGLVYEVVWARQLGLFLGITSFAHTAVITAYMAGLAAGSLYFGRRADTSGHPLKIYAWLEIAVGLYAASTPWLFDWLQAGYAGLAGTAGVSGMPGHLLRFTIAMAALLLPTFLMGGTLPLLVRGFVRSLPDLGQTTSRLYGLNTLGAMAGTLAAGYLLIPAYGLTLAIMFGVVLNIGIALLVLGLLKAIPRVAESAPAGTEPTAPALARTRTVDRGGVYTRFAILIGFGLAGFASLLTQMAWIRALILVIGGSVYAFTITLASFLAGIGLGSLAYARFLSTGQELGGSASNTRRLTQAAGLALLISLTLLAGLAMIGRLPVWFLDAWASGLHANFVVFQAFIFLLCFSLMILPTLFMGALFPLVTVVWTRRFSGAGRGVGQAYAINTTGTIFGALLGGLLILPWLGVRGSLLLTSAIYLFVTLLFWLAATSQRKASYRVLGAVLCLLAVGVSAWQVPPWDRMLMSAGAFYRPSATMEKMRNWEAGEALDEQLLFYAEGLDGTVTVKTDGTSRYLAINGKTDASSHGDLPTQVLLGRLPMQMDRKFRNALIIGLGSGITAGTVARSEEIESLTVLELSSEVVTASIFFRPENYGVLADPRVQLVTADARNYLLAADRQFDLIVSEPSNPWISGISNLFTAEAFELARQRLAPGGVMVQWFHLYSMSTDDLKSVLRTFSEAFAHVSVWQPMAGDLVMLGSDQPHHLRLHDADPMGTAVNREELARAGIHNDRDLVRKYLLGGEALRRYAADARLNTDAHPVIEFSAPRNLYAETLEDNLADMAKFSGGASQAVPVENLYRVDGNVIRADAMVLDITLREEEPPRDLQSEWSVARRLLQVGDDPALGVGSGRRLSWNEGATKLYVQATWHKELPDRPNLLNTLKGLFKDGGVRGGDITLIGGHEGVWLQGEAAEDGRYPLGVAWSCAAEPEGFTRYAAFEQRPAAAMDGWGRQLTQFAQRFECRSPGGESAGSD